MGTSKLQLPNNKVRKRPDCKVDCHTAGHSADIEGFLAECQVTTVRIMEDKIDRKPKGFGYVEFATPEGLRKALDLTETPFMGRNIKISVADPRTKDLASCIHSR